MIEVTKEDPLEKSCKKREEHFLKSTVRKRLIILAIVFIAIFIASFSIGRYKVPIGDVIEILKWRIVSLFNPSYEGAYIDSQMKIVVLNVRLPRIIAASLIGGALAISGSVYQGIFKNPMVSPDILGSSAGAGFGAALAILMSLSGAWISLSAFIFGVTSTIAAVFISSRFKGNASLGLVLSGIMIGSLFSSCTSFVKLVADPTDQLPAITYWLMGSLASIRMEDLKMLIPSVLIGIVPVILLRWRLNIITLGDDEAHTLGVDAARMRFAIILAINVMTSACVAVSGMIGWVGLVVPHLARSMVGCDFKSLIPSSLLIGSSFLLFVDNLSRTVASSEIPIGILTAFIGTPFFLWILINRTKSRKA